MNKKLTLLALLILMFIVSGCPTANTTKEKEVEVKEKETALKENELEMKEEAPKEEESIEEKEDSETETASETKEEKPSTDGKVYTPKKGSAERKAIFNALRVPVEKELKQEIVFAPNNFKVFGDWAFIGGEPKTKAGKTPSYKGTKYQEAVEADMFDNNFFALLKRNGSKWKVVKYYIGCTDVCYLGWDKEFNAPKEIFP